MKPASKCVQHNISSTYVALANKSDKDFSANPPIYAIKLFSFIDNFLIARIRKVCISERRESYLSLFFRERETSFLVCLSVVTNDSSLLSWRK